MENYLIAGRTDVGATRQNNEDSLVAFQCSTGNVVAVCDGMGGANGGETASTLAVSIIQDILGNNYFEDPAEAIHAALTAANKGILHRASLSPQLEGMGSTCVMAIIKDGKVYYGSVGDSRIYLYQPGLGFKQITKDQSYVQMLVDAGEITPEEAEHHPRKNEITNVLGIPDMASPAVCQEPLMPPPGSYLLLCSDGLSGMVPDNMMEHVLLTPGLSLDAKVQRLINMANEAGGLDNITLQLVEWTDNNKGAAPDSQPGQAVLGETTDGSSAIHRKYKLRGILCMLITVLVLAGGGAYLFFSGSDKQAEPVAPTPVPTPTPVKPEQPEQPEQASPSGRTIQKKTKETIVVKEKQQPAKKQSESRQPSKNQPASRKSGNATTDKTKDTHGRNNSGSNVGKAVQKELQKSNNAGNASHGKKPGKENKQIEF